MLGDAGVEKVAKKHKTLGRLRECFICEKLTVVRLCSKGGRTRKQSVSAEQQ